MRKFITPFFYSFFLSQSTLRLALQSLRFLWLPFHPTKLNIAKQFDKTILQNIDYI
jgi:hypothetical protein